MNRIILAYAGANADLAHQIDNQLSRIGIPFEHVSSAAGTLAPSVFASGEPVLLLVTDNLLKDRAAMRGMLDGLQKFPSEVPFLPVIADGVDENGQAVSTQLDRMVNMLHYMNYWQSEWLRLSAAQQASDAAERAALDPELDAVRTIANQTSDLITALRELGAVSLQELSAQDFALFFQKFGLSDWHGQYRRLVAQQEQGEAIHEPEHLPETPIFSGILTPEPVEEVLPVEEEMVHPTTPLAPESEPEAPVFESTRIASDPIEQTILDAQFWIDRGHVDQGVELLKIAAEEYPDDERIVAAYKKVAPNAPALPEKKVVAENGQPETSGRSQVPESENDANSYDLMGDMACEKGDFLFAKYCWDRVAEVSPNFPGIYRKLGLMTAEHLHDYRETAIHYLTKALESNAQDAEVQAALAGLKGEVQKVQDFVEPIVPVEEPILTIPVEEIPVPEPVEELQADPVPMVETPRPIAGTVLITGATSGIGRATAEIFARNGYRLILTGRRVERLVEVKNHLETAYQTDALLLPFDVRDAGAVQAALGNLPESYQDIDILVNNAGLAKGLSPIQEGSLDHWETMIDTNVKGLLYVTRVISPGMVARKRGHIINICSSAGKEVYPNGNVYCATKYAVDALTKAMRLDLHAHNIRVSQVSPGHVEETEFAITRFDGDAARAQIYKDFQPLKSSDVADVIYFMATRPAHVNIQDVQMFATQQASSTVINRSGR